MLGVFVLYVAVDGRFMIPIMSSILERLRWPFFRLLAFTISEMAGAQVSLGRIVLQIGLQALFGLRLNGLVSKNFTANGR